MVLDKNSSLSATRRDSWPSLYKPFSWAYAMKKNMKNIKIQTHICTGDSCYMRFCHLHFHICMVLFQYHVKHQYPICSHGRSCCADPMSYAWFHWLAPPFWLWGLQIKVSHGVSLKKSMGMFPVLCIFYIQWNPNLRDPHFRFSCI
jgi:hypothetical protein